MSPPTPKRHRHLSLHEQREREQRLIEFAQSLLESFCSCDWPDEGEDGAIACHSCAAREALGLEPLVDHESSARRVERREQKPTTQPGEER
jgi:hypothetical protein